MWLIPLAIVTALGILSWSATHSLDPHKPIRIEVVSLDWKWRIIIFGTEKNILFDRQIRSRPIPILD